MPDLDIFVVEDDEWYAEFISYTLSLDQDVRVTKFLNGNDCIKNLKTKPDVITIDYRLPDMSGETLLKTIKDFDQDIEIVVISEQEKIEIAVELLKLGAYDYIVKSMDIRERLLNVVRNLKKQSNLKKQLVSLQSEVEKKYDFEKLIIGQSKPIKKIFGLIEKAINTSISVTITGETGTGKDLVAKAIHYNSERKRKPFVAINMAAIPKELVESELFGHEKGAFTGAHISRKGKFEEADGGTLFLDEIGEMDLTLQAKLLRALQEREVTPVGSNKSIQVNCRILVATNKNLLQKVRSGSFRDDLYYRLFGLGINMPPLRDRDNDILLLAKHFMKVYCHENNLTEKLLSREAQKKLMTYAYPGNVRELKSVIELSVVLSNNFDIEAEDINFSEDDTLPEMINRELTLREHNLRIVKSYLKKYDGNVKEAARKLDIGFSTIYRMLKEEEEQFNL
ncbi:MAG: sigma-54-dependent Fis family transcriptional regulator [Cyclobacteriaceae bacterium]|nr:sigma-54-dependent Fis family transcriptional regulator [Cyclobacteriaceae bacterium]